MKFLFNAALLKEQLKRYWAIGALTMLVYFLCCLMPLWGANNMHNATFSMLDIVKLKNPFILVMNIIAPMAAVIAIFSYMYRQNSTGIIHSLPFTKTQLFATNLLAGYLLTVIPLIIFSVLLLTVPVELGFGQNYGISNVAYIAVELFPDGLSIGQVINTVPVVFGFFVKTLLSFTFYYALFVMAAMIVGNRIVYIIISALLPFLTLGFYLLFGLVSAYFVFGFYFDTTPFDYILLYTNPIFLGTTFSDTLLSVPYTGEVFNFMPLYATYILLTVAMLSVSVWLYHTRKLERAGDTIVFTPVKNFFIFILAITGMISLGTFFLVFFSSVFSMYVGFVIGFIIGFFIAEMIAEKSFNVFYKYKDLLKHGCVIVGIFIATVIVTKADLTGYVRHVPDASEIEGVYFGMPSNYRLNSIDDNTIDVMFINNPEIISETINLHNKIIADRSEQRKVFLDSVSSNYRSGYVPRIQQNVIYKLTNGKFVIREYVLSEEFYIESGLRNLMLTDDVMLSELCWVNFLDDIESIIIEPFEIEMLENGFENYKYYGGISIYKRDELESLTDALIQDYKSYKTNLAMKNNLSFSQIHINVTIRMKTNDNNMLFSFINNNNQWEFSDNTIKWLDMHGYPSSDIIIN